MEILKLLLKIEDCKNPFAPTSSALVDNLGISKFRLECHSSKINRFGKYGFYTIFPKICSIATYLKKYFVIKEKSYSQISFGRHRLVMYFIKSKILLIVIWTIF